MNGYGNYDRNPVIQVTNSQVDCLTGWKEILSHLKLEIPVKQRYVVAFECYPGVSLDALEAMLKPAFAQARIINVQTAFRAAVELQAEFAPILTDDPVFGFMQPMDIVNFFDETRLKELRTVVNKSSSPILLIGAGTTHVVPEPDLLLHASVTRWELQRRQRAGDIGNLGFDNRGAAPSQLYKNAFFLEWRVADEIRHTVYDRINYFLDLDDPDEPQMVAAETLRRAVQEAVHRPFRVVPFFDPSPWGGTWMKDTFDLPDGPSNYGWCFDCVPEENSVNLGFGSRRFRMPAITLVHEQPLALLGDTIYQKFGAEFPIRFDLLDTVGGGNLSLQVHPLEKYMREHFGMPYTQDESYYILDSREGSDLYLGLRECICPEEMKADLEAAQDGKKPFPAKQYVNIWPTRKHDHFSIPAGTVHCSGSDNLVLEISTTPYIFTFKLWDWGRAGLDGKPRPIHLQHGLANIRWNRDTAWVRRELLNQVEKISEGKGWREERTGLHSAEFLETRRTWFTESVQFDTEDTLHVLNLVEGEAVIVESMTGAFKPLEIHYAETFIVPAAVGRYMVRPAANTNRPLGMIRAYVRAR
jgi:mannose-6-phosphate isomerase class I